VEYSELYLARKQAAELAKILEYFAYGGLDPSDIAVIGQVCADVQSLVARIAPADEADDQVAVNAPSFTDASGEIDGFVEDDDRVVFRKSRRIPLARLTPEQARAAKRDIIGPNVMPVFCSGCGAKCGHRRPNGSIVLIQHLGSHQGMPIEIVWEVLPGTQGKCLYCGHLSANLQEVG
jgi:hypothetical protein